MKSKTLQKVLAIFLALGMLIGYLPISASAQAPVIQEKFESNPNASELGPGEFYLGDYEPTDEQQMADGILSLDDGVAENGIGIGGTSAFIAVNRFTPQASQYPMLLTEVQYSMQASGQVLVGDPVKVVVYKNTTGNTDPAVGSEFLYQQSATVVSATSWNTVVLNDPVILDGPGDVLIGVIYEKVPGSEYYPASIDETSSQERSWVGSWIGAIPTTPVLPPDSNWLLIDLASGDIEGGNWMIRGKVQSLGDYELTGTVTNTIGTPVADATITLNPGGRTAKTNASGVYSMMLDAGDYTVTAGKFGYLDQTKPVTIPEGATEPVVLDFQLTGLSSLTVNGIVSDGGTDEANKHGYPLYAKITFSTEGETQVVYTNPFTGAYEVSLLSENEYTAKVEAMVSGYDALNETFTPVGETEFVKNFAIPINNTACAAPGYEKNYDVAFYDFETGPQGFTFGGTNSTWAHGTFTSITNGPTSAHGGDYGIATNPAGQYANSELSWAKSPVIDLSGLSTDKAVVLEWWQWLYTESATSPWDIASVEFTKDGTTWTTVWGPFPRQDKEWKLEKLTIDPEFYTDKFQFRFWFKSDDSGLQAGWYIDDIGLGIVEGVPQATPVKTYNFDGADDAEWTTDKTGSGANSWAKGEPVTGPAAANTSPNVWATNLSGNYDNNEVSFITSPVIDMSDYVGGVIEVQYFDWLEIESVNSTYDLGRLKATANGTTWDTLVDNIRRKDVTGAAMSAQKIVLDQKYTTKDFQFRFEFKSDGSDNYQGWYIDSVQFAATEPFQAEIACVPQNGGVVAGYAIDHWEQEKMYDVQVESENAVAITQPSSDHPESDGLYWLFQPFTGAEATETVTFTASKDRFGAETDNVDVKQSQIVRKDWELTSGKLVANPEALERTIALFDDPETIILNIENLGGVDANFNLSEYNVGFQPYSIPPFTGEIQSSEESSLLADSSPATKAETKLESTAVLPLILEGGPQAFAMEIRQEQKTLKNIPDITVPGTWSDVANIEPNFYAGDFLKDDYTTMYAVSNTNEFVAVDMATGAITPIKTITPPGDTVSGITGADGFFYGISDTQIFTLDLAGNIEVITNTTIPSGIDIAYVPDNGLLYVVDLQNDHLFSVNPNTGQTIDVGALGFDGNYAQGMDYDEANKVLYWAAYSGGGDGQLRAIDIETGASALVGAFPGDNETDCLAIAAYAGNDGGSEIGGPIPWLTETPEEGLVAGLETFEIEIEFNVNDIEQPGDYFAELRFTNDTPYELPSIPVTMHVVRPLDWGNIKANIYALEQCDIEPAPADKAGINFYQNGQLVASTETDENGYFSYALQHGTYDVEILKVGHVSQMINEVVVGWDEDTILDDINLRLDAACLILDPDSIYQEQFANLVTKQTLTFINIGARETVFEITEKDRGGPNPFTMAEEVNLILDDGSFDNAVGIGGTKDFMAINRFTPAADQFPMMLTEVSIYFGASNVESGQPFKVLIYQNTSGNSNNPAIGSELIYQQAATTGSVPGWTVVTLDEPVELEGPGDVLIGGLFTYKPGSSYHPASLDQNFSQQRSWIGWWDDENAPDTPTLPPNGTWSLIDNASSDLAGNWMIRAKGTQGGIGTGGDILWLDIDVLADVVLPDGGQVDVTLTFDSNGLLWGDYFGQLLVTNVPDPRITVPVQLRVLPFSWQYLPMITNYFEIPAK